MSDANPQSISQAELELLEDPFEECHYQRLSYKGRSNIYSLAIPDYNFGAIDFKEPLPRLSILAALSDGVYILQENNNNWSTITESVDPGEEFTSLDAYYPENSNNGSFLICYSKINPDNNTYSINFSKLAIIEKSLGNKVIEVVDRFHIPVLFAPLKITHANYFDQSQRKPSFIVCSSSQSVHAFIQKGEDSIEFIEVPLEDIYPELLFLKECDSSILALTIQTTGNVRFVAAGCQDGSLICKGVRYNSGNYEFFSSSKSKLYYPISSLIFFEQSEFRDGVFDKALLVTCSVNIAVVFRDLELVEPIYLTIPYEGDSVLSAALSDVDLDGCQEIVLGTYNQQLLIYKSVGFKNFTLVSQRKLPYPIYGLIDCDFDADGLKELIVLTMYGVHVLKPCLSTARKRILSYLDYLKNSSEFPQPKNQLT